MDEQQFKVIARFTALEYLVKHLLWNLVTATTEQNGGDDAVAMAELGAFMENVEDDLRKQTFPGLDPAASDHLAALAAEDVQRVLGDLRQEMEAELDGQS